MAFIYVITNDINGKQYVGKTIKTINKRFQQHLTNARFGKQYKNYHLYRAMNKYGFEHFSIAILEECKAEDAAEREKYWIEKLNTYGENGYNCTIGGDGNQLYDYKELSDAYIELGTLKAVAEKFHCDDSTVRIACENYNVPIAESKWEARPIVAFDKTTLEYKYSFNSLYDASSFLHKGRGGTGHISMACQNKKKSAYGFIWRYLDDLPDNWEQQNPKNFLIKLDTNNRRLRSKIPVAQIETETGKIIHVYNCASDASLDIKGTRRYSDNIARVCEGKRKTAYGYKWEYVDNDSNNVDMRD